MSNVRKRRDSNASSDISVLETQAQVRARVHEKAKPLVRPGYGVVHTRVMHPPLSSENEYAYSYQGFRNLAILILVVSNLRLVIENILKYGVLVDGTSVVDAFLTQDFTRWPTLSMLVGLVGFALLSWSIEAVASRRWVPNIVANAAHVANVTASLVVPCVWIWNVPSHPILALVLVLSSVTLFLKLWSYAVVNGHARAYRSAEPGYPASVSLPGMLWFLAAPTLCYQFEYPRTPVIRGEFLVRRTAEFVFFFSLVVALAQQYMVPTVDNTMQPIRDRQYVKVLERLLKVATPNFLIWFLGFYAYFHVYLSIAAEITRFGDRVFYKDWWSSTTLSRFWRTWNLPVHMWLVQHIYKPLQRYGVGKQAGYVACFTFSAILHELIIDIAFRRLGWLAFAGMMLQIPACALTDSFTGSTLGNVIMWLSLVLGQPLAVLGYYAVLSATTTTA